MNRRDKDDRYSSSKRSSRDSDRSERRRKHDSRSRSRSNDKSPYRKPKTSSYSSSRAPSNSARSTAGTGSRAGNGPYVFTGTPGAIIQKTPLVSKDKKEPSYKSTYSTFKDSRKMEEEGKNLDKNYKAFEWEEFERDAERDWYDQEEGGVMDDQEDHHFVGDKGKYHAMEEQMKLVILNYLKERA